MLRPAAREGGAGQGRQAWGGGQGRGVSACAACPAISQALGHQAPDLIGTLVQVQQASWRLQGHVAPHHRSQHQRQRRLAVGIRIPF